MSVLDAPGKLAVVNIASAGSPVAKPRVAVGTRRWFSCHTSPRVADPPRVRACLPFSQFSVSSITIVEPSRALGVDPGYGLLMLLKLLQLIA